MTLWTIGHSNHRIEKLIELLNGHEIEQLADVRGVPKSRYNPQFNREAMPGPLRAAGIMYSHHPGLAGMRTPRADSVHTGFRETGFRGYADHMETAEFREALEGLIAMAREDRTAVMCAEAIPWQCHRSLLSDALLVRNVRVEHIQSVHATQAHRLTSFAYVRGTDIVYQRQLQLITGDS